MSKASAQPKPKKDFSRVAANVSALRGEGVQSSAPAATQTSVDQEARGRKVGKKNDKANFTQVTVYLHKDVHRTARKLLFDEGKQFSVLVDELVSQWISEVQKSSLP